MADEETRVELVAYAYEVRPGDHLVTGMDTPTPVIGASISGDTVTLELEDRDPLTTARMEVLDVQRSIVGMVGYFPVQVLP